jgi:4-hydroxy-tetrahydrodipicolinate synthase
MEIAAKIPNPGVYAAALTPVRPDLSIDGEELSHHCRDLIQRGCQGVVLFGTTGEGASLSLKCRCETLERVLAKGIEPGRVLIANGSSSIDDTVTLGRFAFEKGVSTFLISPPSFYKNVREEGVIAYYREVISQLPQHGLQVLLYHIPQFSGVPITLAIIEALRKEFPERVTGIKESEGNLGLVGEILESHPGFQVFVGNESQIPEAVRMGGAGSICGIANLFPELICSLYHEPKRIDEEKLASFFKLLEKIPFIPAAKAILEKRRGDVWRTLFPPLFELKDEEKLKFLRSLSEIGS